MRDSELGLIVPAYWGKITIVLASKTCVYEKGTGRDY